MNEAWKRMMNNFVECFEAIETLKNNYVIDQDDQSDLKNELLERIIEDFKTEVKD